MCQILATNAAEPTSFFFCFKGFCNRVAKDQTARNVDGWGMATYDGRRVTTFLDICACSRSPVARFVQDCNIPTKQMIAHVRYATVGRVGVENVHPFTRELWGMDWSFAHNGVVTTMSHQRPGSHICLGKSSENDLVYHAIGDTDSEMMFCAILNGLRAEFPNGPPSLSNLYSTVDILMQDLHRKVAQSDTTYINNFILGCGPEVLLCYSWPGRLPTSKINNGLSFTSFDAFTERLRFPRYEDEDFSIAFGKKPCPFFLQPLENVKTVPRRLAIIASKPKEMSKCTDMLNWTEMSPNQLVLFKDGLPYFNVEEVQTLDKENVRLPTRWDR